MLQKKALDLMPTVTKYVSIPLVAHGLSDLTQTDLYTFVGPAARGPFDAAAHIISDLERDMPLRVQDANGSPEFTQFRVTHPLNGLTLRSTISALVVQAP